MKIAFDLQTSLLPPSQVPSRTVSTGAFRFFRQKSGETMSGPQGWLERRTVDMTGKHGLIQS